MIFDIITIVFNILLGWFVFHRFGRQSAYNDLLKAYTEVCKQRDMAIEQVDHPYSVLKNKCNKKKTEEEL